MLLDVSGNDFDKAAETFGASFDTPPIRVTPTEKTFWWRQTIAGDAILNLRKSWASARFEMTSTTASDSYLVSWIESGQTIFDNNGTTRASPQRLPFVMLNGKPAGKTTAIDVIVSNVDIDQNFVRGVAQELKNVDFLDFETLIPIRGSRLQTWRRTLDLVGSIVLGSAQPTSALLRQEMPRLVAIAMLNCFPYQSHERPSRTSGIEPTSVKLAVEYVHQNAHLPIGPLEVAQAAGISIRSLQQALRRYRETTPTALLHSIRLDRVHAELRAADPSAGSVSIVARRWGFVHLGRFSASYHARFDQFPGETLRNASARSNG